MAEKVKEKIDSTKLDKKLNQICKYLENLSNQQISLNEFLTEFTSTTAQWIEERRKEATEIDRRFQAILNYRILLFGFLMGVLGNLLTSSFMEVLRGSASRIFWLFPLTIGSIMTIISIIPYYLEMKRWKKETGKSVER